MKALVGFSAVALFFALGAVAHAQTNQGNNQNNNNNNVTPLSPRISRPARIRDPMLRRTPQQFIAQADRVTNRDPTTGAPLATAPPTNGPDGRVTRFEFLAALRVRNRNINVAQTNALFDTLDTDLDDFISLADFSQFFLLPGGGGT